MNLESAVDFSRNLAGIADTLSFALPVAAGLAGFFGLASLFFFSFIRKH